MALADIIRGIPNWTTKTAAELRADLLDEITGEDRTLYTGKHVVKVIGTDAYRLVAGTIQAAAEVDPLASDARFWLGSEGLDFSDQDTQDMLDQLAGVGSWPIEVLTALKRIGRPVQTYYTSQGGSGNVPSEADISLALEALALEDAKQTMRNNAANRYNTYINAVDAWDGVGQGPVL
jgi:hypothetical protein